jgi:hypothetical protein
MKTTRFLLTSLLFLSFFGSCPVFAKSKIDVMGGYFSLEAKTKEKSGNVNNFGSYQIGLRYAANAFLEASVVTLWLLQRRSRETLVLDPILDWFTFHLLQLIQSKPRVKMYTIAVMSFINPISQWLFINDNINLSNLPMRVLALAGELKFIGKKICR